ncbi:ATP-dependent DNA helicase [Hoyosella altamirensis]|uniref:ATP-dependent helicase DinG n=1 Tax=Hoyosella altamirensis TaxID=616997 RepID=A0A839RGF0_9ACTN|nr:ATP-dependent DNA helicase DinG [Hoyosella altamirensis]
MTSPPVAAGTPAVLRTQSLLRRAVEALGGKERSGQLTMTSAVAHAIDTGEHLAVQAGTGTGKSLAYLVPGIAHAVQSGSTVVVSTATIALQKQLIDRDLPRLAEALKPALGRAPEFAILKGRNNYLCLNKLHNTPDDPDDGGGDGLFDPFAASRLGRDVRRLHEWAEETESGDREEVIPGVTDQAWRQISVTSRECLGVSRCPIGEQCFAERARVTASHADVVVTNHALLAIGALSEASILPDHDVVIIDEAHELVDRVTGAATAELTSASVIAAARKCVRLIEDAESDALHAVADDLDGLLENAPEGLWETLSPTAALVLSGLRDAAWTARTAIGPIRQGMAAAEPEAAAARTSALALLDELHDTAVRVLEAYGEPDPARRRDVVWLNRDDRRGDVLRVAPLSVAGLLRSRLFAEATVILTSATLAIGGTFDALARNWGLPTQSSSSEPGPDPALASGKETPSDASALRWTSLDAGSPFDHPRAGILYTARHLPPPGRDGLAPACLDEIAALVDAVGGRTLGLFSSMRAARAAADALQDRISTPILCQGDNSTGQLVRQFSADEATSLFGTLSLWQGVDVPGPSLSLVIVDRIPFPRPDDPLLRARQRAVEARGGNGFMTVAASHAALLLAQGAGRLLRSVDDIGVVAILDPRLATARYGNYLRASLPPFWQTTDRDVALGALQRIRARREL